MRPQGWSRKRTSPLPLPQVQDFKQLPCFPCLTLEKCGTYTHRMGKVSLFGGALCLALYALTTPAALEAQALQRSIYASAVDQNGAPVPNLGPADFVVREDKVAREILAVAPATDPMQIALLVDNSQAGEQFTRVHQRDCR